MTAMCMNYVSMKTVINISDRNNNGMEAGAILMILKNLVYGNKQKIVYIDAATRFGLKFRIK